MDELTGAERLARRSRGVTLLALALMTLLAWAWLLQGAGMHSAATPMEGMASPEMVWDIGRWLIYVAMWWVMMIAMMLPSAAPMILLYGRVRRHSAQGVSPTAVFLAGYLAMWLGFALLAASLHGLLEQRGPVSTATMALPSGSASAGFLIAAGFYQLSPLKDACLSNCRSPAAFLTRHYRPDRRGAWRMGLLHGAFCVGCCWLLMALLFVGGVMNLAWIAALTLLVAAEKLLPRGEWIARIAGMSMIAWGVVLLAR